MGDVAVTEYGRGTCGNKNMRESGQRPVHRRGSGQIVAKKLLCILIWIMFVISTIKSTSDV
jgi:hypothetical protein